MKINIDASALTGDNRDSFKRGVFYGLERLRRMNYRPEFDQQNLTENQIEKLRYEGFLPDQEGSNGEQKAAFSLQYNSNDDRLEVLETESGEVIAAAEAWGDLVEQLLFPVRKVQRVRSTSETNIRLSINLDGTGESHINTGLNFFDHMLDQIARHGLIDLDIECDGDLEIDEHHTIEDVAIVLGEALYELCGKDKTGIQRYGFLLPMDEAQARVAIDLSNRPYLVWEVTFEREYVGDFPLEMARHFFHTLAMNLRATLQITASGENEHHKIEAIFKGVAKALRFAVTRSERNAGLLPSSKGTL